MTDIQSERDGETLSATIARLTDALQAIADGVDDPALVAQMALFAKGLVR